MQLTKRGSLGHLHVLIALHSFILEFVTHWPSHTGIKNHTKVLANACSKQMRQCHLYLATQFARQLLWLHYYEKHCCRAKSHNAHEMALNSLYPATDIMRA